MTAIEPGRPENVLLHSTRPGALTQPALNTRPLPSKKPILRQHTALRAPVVLSSEASYPALLLYPTQPSPARTLHVS